MKRKQIGVIDRSNPEDPFIKLSNEKSFKQDLSDFKDGQRVWIEVSTYYRKRTIEQNGLFHVYCQEIADYTGQDMESVKSTVKLLYARKPLLDKDGQEQFNMVTGELLEYVQDTSDMSTVEMALLIDNTIMFAQDFFGIVLTEPDQQKALKF